MSSQQYACAIPVQHMTMHPVLHVDCTVKFQVCGMYQQPCLRLLSMLKWKVVSGLQGSAMHDHALYVWIIIGCLGYRCHRIPQPRIKCLSH